MVAVSRLKAVWGGLVLRASSGRMVIQTTADFLVGGSNPVRAKIAVPPPTTVSRPGSEPPT